MTATVAVVIPNWNGRDLGELRKRVAAYEAVGVQHIMIASDLL